MVVLLEQHRTADENLAVIGDPDLDARRRLSNGVEFHAAIGLQAHVGASFSGTVELLQVDTDRAVETEQIRPDRRTRGVSNANAAHAEHVAQRPVDQGIADGIRHAIGYGHRATVEDLGAAAPRYRGKAGKQPALERVRVLHPDHHLREQIFEYAWRREVIRRPDLTQVGHYRLA